MLRGRDHESNKERSDTMPYCMYLRKSRADSEAEQRGEGETLARHEKALTAFAKQAGLEVTAVYKEIISGESIAARPQMQRLLSEVSEGLWEGVIVMDVDRLARGNSIDQGIISQTFLFAGTKIITPTKTYDPQNEMDEEYFEFGLFMSRREYKIINRRLQRGRTASVKEGKYVSNKAPFGYERTKIINDKGFTLSPIPDQAAVVRSIFEWYTQGLLQENGTRKLIGTSLIARELNERGIKAASGSVWTQQTIRDMLINPVYVGKIRWNWRPRKKKMTGGTVITQRPRNDVFLLYNGLHPAIIDEQTFKSAAERMAQNKNRTVRGDKSTQNPLAGLVCCTVCGRKMQRKPSSKNPDLLMCPAPTCSNHASYLYLVEKAVVDMIGKWAKGYCLPQLEQYRTKINIDKAKSELSLLLASESKLRAQISKVYEAFETGVYDAVEFRQRNQVLQQRLRELKDKQKDVQSSTEKAARNERILSEFIPKVRMVSESYDTLSDAQNKNEMLKKIIHHIDYTKTTKGHGHEEEFSITIYPSLPIV